MSKGKRRVSVAVVRPTCRFFPKAWNNVPLIGEVLKVEASVSPRMARALVNGLNRATLAEAAAAGNASPCKPLRWAVIVDGRTTRVYGSHFFHARTGTN